MWQHLPMSLLKKGAMFLPCKNYYCIAGNTLHSLRTEHHREPYRRLHCTPILALTIMQKSGTESLLERIKAKFKISDESKHVLMSLGFLSYEYTVDQINYKAFYEDFNMPDTFFSWFLVTELHVWMVMLRFMADGPKSGKILRNSLVEAMWQDCFIRIDKLGHIPSSIKRKQLKQLTSQFNAAIIAYDEGILSDDKVLAGALWRTFFNSSCNNPEQLEKLLHYVRKHVKMLDQLSSQEIRRYREVNWTDLRSIS